jgi:hypothetical protein
VQSGLRGSLAASSVTAAAAADRLQLVQQLAASVEQLLISSLDADGCKVRSAGRASLPKHVCQSACQCAGLWLEGQLHGWWGSRVGLHVLCCASLLQLRCLLPVPCFPYSCCMLQLTQEAALGRLLGVAASGLSGAAASGQASSRHGVAVATAAGSQYSLYGTTTASTARAGAHQQLLAPGAFFQRGGVAQEPCGVTLQPAYYCV